MTKDIYREWGTWVSSAVGSECPLDEAITGVCGVDLGSNGSQRERTEKCLSFQPASALKLRKVKKKEGRLFPQGRVTLRLRVCVLRARGAVMLRLRVCSLPSSLKL